MSDIEPRGPEPQPEPQPGPKPGPKRWRERTWPLSAVVGVALVAVLLGGLGGAALASVGDHQDGRRGAGFGGPGQPFGGRQRFRFQDPYGQHRGFGGQGGQHAPAGPSGPLTPFGTPSPGATPTPAPSS